MAYRMGPPRSYQEIVRSRKRIAKALRHPDKLGAGAAARRKHLKRSDEYVTAVMKEFYSGTLHGPHGKKIKRRDRALAIGISEAKRNVPRRDWTAAMKRWEKKH